MDLLLAKPHSSRLRLRLRLLLRLFLSVSPFVLRFSPSVSPLSVFVSVVLRSFFDFLSFVVALRPKIEARGHCWGLRSYVGPYLSPRSGPEPGP
jgi:hypothetical protein